MLKNVDPYKCSGCGACIASCPRKCVKFDLDEEGFWYPKVDTDNCVNCGKCDSVCPFNIDVDKKDYNPIVAAVKAMADEVRYKSSSGGIFSVLAMECLKRGGTVCGAAMSHDCREVHHILIKDSDGLTKLRGSKYIPSIMGEVYSQIKSQLDGGMLVLFSGVSCQVAGLMAYLGKEYSNLLTIEIICHGVPSLALWKKYIDYWEGLHKGKVREVYFRSKKVSWSDFGQKYITRNGKEYFQMASVNPYFLMFNSGMALRKSCYKCTVKQGQCEADISIGDFWHIEDIAPQFCDNKGISLVLINSEKGEKWFESIKADINYLIDPSTISFEVAAKFNPGVSRSLEMDNRRNAFYKDLNTLDMVSFIKKYTPLTRKQKINGYLMKTSLWPYISKIHGGGVKMTDYGIEFIAYKS